jgi:hypothetical protein
VDCKSVIYEALEVVVKDVTAERSGKQASKEDDDKKSVKMAQAKTENDSSLKEGIRRWLAEVE